MNSLVLFRPVKKSDPKAARFLKVLPTQSAKVVSVEYNEYVLDLFNPVTGRYDIRKKFYGTSDTKQFRSSRFPYARIYSDMENEYIDFIEFSEYPFAEEKGLTDAEKAAVEFFRARYKALNRSSKDEVKALLTYYGTMPEAAKAAVAPEYQDLKGLEYYLDSTVEAADLDAKLQGLVTFKADKKAVDSIKDANKAKAKTVATRLAVIGSGDAKTRATNVLTYLEAAEKTDKLANDIKAANARIEAERKKAYDKIETLKDKYNQVLPAVKAHDAEKSEKDPAYVNIKVPTLTQVAGSYVLPAGTTEANLEANEKTQLDAIRTALENAEKEYDDFKKDAEKKGFNGVLAR